MFANKIFTGVPGTLTTLYRKWYKLCLLALYYSPMQYYVVFSGHFLHKVCWFP